MNFVARRHGNTVTITLPIRLGSVSNLREHWSQRAKRAKSHRGSVSLAVAYYARELGLPVTVTLTRIAPRALDDDNLRGALKATRDGIADAFGVDDRDPRITWLYAQRRGKPREYGLEIAIAGPRRPVDERLDEPPPSGVSLVGGED